MRWISEADHPEILFQTVPSSLFHPIIKPPDSKAAPDSRIAELLWISEAVRLPLAEQNTCELTLEQNEMIVVAAAKGRLYAEAAGIQGNIFRGQAFFLAAPVEQCRLTAYEASECTILVLNGSLPVEILEKHIQEEKLFCPSGLSDVMEAVATLTEDHPSPEQISLSAYQLLMRLHETAKNYEETSGYPLLVDTAIGIIQNEFAQITGVDEVAERLEVSESHLIRQFSHAVGMTPGRYLKLRRIACAKELLTQPEITVSLAADLCGFSDANYFAKVFRKETGLSPSKYAQLHAAGRQTDTTVRDMIDQMYL